MHRVIDWLVQYSKSCNSLQDTHMPVNLLTYYYASNSVPGDSCMLANSTCQWLNSSLMRNLSMRKNIIRQVPTVTIKYHNMPLITIFSVIRSARQRWRIHHNNPWASNPNYILLAKIFIAWSPGKYLLGLAANNLYRIAIFGATWLEIMYCNCLECTLHKVITVVC